MAKFVVDLMVSYEIEASSKWEAMEKAFEVRLEGGKELFWVAKKIRHKENIRRRARKEEEKKWPNT